MPRFLSTIIRTIIIILPPSSAITHQQHSPAPDPFSHLVTMPRDNNGK